MGRNRCTDSIISGKECSICKEIEKVGKFNKKKHKIKRIFARFVRGGKWHVTVDEGHSIFFPCQHYGWYGGLNEMSPERTGGVFRGPFDGYIFTKPHKICGTCMKMERNKKILKEAGFTT